MEYIKQSMNDIWAAAGDVVMPDEVKIAEGWLVEVPPRQYWNWMQNRTDVNLAYIFQRGIPDWDISVEYLANRSFVVYNGVVYKCILTGVGKNPESQPTYWVRAFRDWSAIGQAVDNLTPAADRFVYYTGVNTAALGTVTSFARSILDDTSAAAVRTTIGAQASDATLTAVAGVTTAANKLIYFTGVDTAAATDLSAFGRSLIDDADASAARTTLGLASGATTTVGTMATQNTNSVSITGGSITGITDLAITDGGTGASTAEGARSNLGLGTAAVANVTTSNNDTTAGRLMKTGDFGLGAGQMAVSDCNSAILTGFYVTSGSAANKPAGATASVRMSVFGDASTVIHQYCYDPITSNVHYRRLSSSVWSEWRKFFHSGNQLDIGTTATSARTALGLDNVDNTSDATKSIGGNAATATKLATARTIGGVSFDGTANIDLPGVNAAGNQNTSGNAATATKLQTPRTINGVSFDGSANITVTDSTKVPLTSATGAAVIPAGTEAQRPASPVNGQLRYNSGTSQFEGYQGGAWKPIGGGGDSSPMFSVMWWPQRSAIPAGYVAADGQTLSRATYPDAWAGIQAGNVPTVADATWNSTPTERGKFTSGDGSTTFRLPDYNGKFAGSLGAVFLRGDGALSAAIAGTIQTDGVRAHTHTVGVGGSGTSVATPGDTCVMGSNSATASPRGHVSTTGGAETRPLNVTGCWVIKLFGAVVNVGSADAAQLASDYANLAGRVSTLEVRQRALGYGQTWQDVTASRVVGTTYTNTTGGPIQVLVQYLDSGVNAVATFSIGALSRTTADLGGGIGYPYWFSAVIPNGATYSISGGVSLPAWWELR